MNGLLTTMITALVLAMAASTETSAKNSELQLPLNEVVEPGVAGDLRPPAKRRHGGRVLGKGWIQCTTISIDERANTLIQMVDPRPEPDRRLNQTPG